MFERFDDDGRRVVVLAQEEARLLSHNYIGTEHVLLALIRGQGTVAAAVLESLGLSLETARARVLTIVGTGGDAPSGHIPFTPRAKKVLELSLREALALGHNYIGSEHILLGVIREGEGVAAQVLVGLGADLDRARARVIELIGNSRDEGQTVRPAQPGVATIATARLIPPMAGTAGGAQCGFCGRDLWDADRYVRGEAVAICDTCVEACHRAVVEAAEGQRALDLPVRVSGADVEDADAPMAIVNAFRAVFNDSSDARAEFLEDGAQVFAYMETVETGVPAGSVRAVRVDRIRFTSGDVADVRFAIVLHEGTAGYVFEGRAVRREGRWLVSRDTFARMVAPVGIQLPPQG